MNEYKDLTESSKSSDLVFDGKLLKVYRDEISLPNGEDATREYIKHVGAVAMVPLTDDGKVIIERQFRYPVRRVVTEIPAGKLDSLTEDRLEAAKRELREETGLTADEWMEIGDYLPVMAYSNERITIYLCRGLHRGAQELDEDEFLNIEEIPLDELVSDIMAGKITDGKTQVAILKVAAILQRENNLNQ